MGDKHNGRLFNTVQSNVPRDFQVAFEQIDREMSQAVQKHGPMNLPTSHVEDFYERINHEKKNIVSRA